MTQAERTGRLLAKYLKASKEEQILLRCQYRHREQGRQVWEFMKALVPEAAAK